MSVQVGHRPINRVARGRRGFSKREITASGATTVQSQIGSRFQGGQQDHGLQS
ncbi:hypothetical protein [Gimesia aquarii]|uniref:hypothetical protein n=1 Tax=Gimesia aquarii TaxID=2527964 RepID=UPI0018D8E4BD|nr:hypothetical protein [Gimesia aquarii]